MARIDEVVPVLNKFTSVNVELKIRVRDRETMQNQLFELFGSMGTVFTEVNYIYSSTVGNLMLRVIGDAPSGTLMAYERIPSSDNEQHVPMITEYRWSEVPSVESMKEVLASSVQQIGVVHKRRSVLTSGKYLVHLDEVDDLETYVEIIYRLSPGDSVRDGLLVLDELMRQMRLDPTLISGMSYHDLIQVRRAEAVKREEQQRHFDSLFEVTY